ncbi:hypothetical protein [Streptantibioticus ferralitis]|uniref:Uncharacterized protein n=1 Tax=Streptantibioticus ferralitis TaxID=236510 RepID=A0ABT5Z3G5_9ACTN|nr:hypothetical protein [Streptantibioticus ferralitis]MDF2258371.1 hypothetical protein [Streptantibioticus ferralitis]
MAFTIEITRHVVSYRTPERVTPPGGRYGGEWMDGDSRTIERPRTERVVYDADDADWWDGNVIAWAVEQIGKTDVTEASQDLIPDAVGEHTWLSGSYADPYRSDQRVTETSVYLRGEWTGEQRAEVFRRATSH